MFLILISFFLGINNKSYSKDHKNIFNINLDKEIKNGNFLIGLKQYLGNKKKYPKLEALIFKNKNVFLTLQSSNGLTYKTKNLKVIFKEIPLEKPLKIEKYVSKPFASFESAKKESLKLEKIGYKPLIAFPESWEIWLPNDSELINLKNFKLKKVLVQTEIVPYLTNEYTLQKLMGPISISSKEDIEINGINHGKSFYLVKDSYGSWTLIQKISFEKYLNGVLPHEMGKNSPLEALKAQAVIARTWALYNSDRFKIDKYHLCITTQCQVYKPYGGNDKTIKAVIDTKNKILAYDNKPINAFYHASNGGISAKASESWEIKDYPYLISKIDTKKSLSKKLINRSDLLDFFLIDKKTFFGKNHYLFRWEKIISSKEIQNLLKINKQLEENMDFLEPKVIKRGQSGRVIKLQIKLPEESNSIFLEKDEIRKNLNFLPSNLFIINKKSDNLWVFRGGGFGHGVGLSQSGAIEMAELGFSYKKILKNYYQSATILDVNNLKN